MLRVALVLAKLAVVTGCAVIERPPPELEGQRAQFVCLRQLASGACLRSEWRCTAPLMITWDIDGNPRCVMPGAR